VFFAELAIKYEYEPEGFELSSGRRYLPDFFLPACSSRSFGRSSPGMFVEIKPANAPHDDRHYEFVEATGSSLLVSYGPPCQALSCSCGEHSVMIFAPSDFTDGKASSDINYRWCECRKCGKLEPQFDGRSARIGCARTDCHQRGSGPHDGHPDKDYNPDSPRLIAAVSRALRERFGT